MKRKIDYNKLLDQLENRLSSDKVPPTYINIFNSGVVIDMKKAAKIAISIIKNSRKKVEK